MRNEFFLRASKRACSADQLSQFTFQICQSILSSPFAIPTANSLPMGVCAVNTGVYVFGLMGRFL